MGQMVYNVNESATQVMAARDVKENIYVDLVHKEGYGVTQHSETNASMSALLSLILSPSMSQ